MRELKPIHKFVFGIGAFIFLAWLGYVVAPSVWYLFVAVPFGGYIIYHGARHGWKFWQIKLRHKERFDKVLTPEEAEYKILKHCDDNDFLIEKTSIKEGQVTTMRISGMKNTPFLVWKRYISQSKEMPCWTIVVCDMSSGFVAHWPFGPNFGFEEMEKELEKMGGIEKFIEKVIMPEQRGPVYERIRVEPPQAEVKA